MTLLARAQVMDLLPPGGIDGELDERSLGPVLARVAEHGLATVPIVEWQAGAIPLDQVLAEALDAVEASPQPDAEWLPLRELLGEDVLAELTAVWPASLRRYAAGERRTPDPVAFLLHQAARAAGAVLGSYNAYGGVRRWFARPRPQLGGRSPGDMIASATGEDDPDLVRVIELADALVGAGGGG